MFTRMKLRKKMYEIRRFSKFFFYQNLKNFMKVKFKPCFYAAACIFLSTAYKHFAYKHICIDRTAEMRKLYT